ncbi:MAG: MoaD/ThiS family protein [Thermodesulfobacteriota bacterium]
MKLRLITNFSFPTGEGGEYRPPASVMNAADLLTHIGNQVGFVFIDASGKILRKDVEVLLNGRDIWFCPAGLETVLNEGDRVEISQMTLGGG